MSLGKVRFSRGFIERFQSRGRLLCKFIEKKESVQGFISENNSACLSLGDQHGGPFIVLGKSRRIRIIITDVKPCQKGLEWLPVCSPKLNSTGWPRIKSMGVGVGKEKDCSFPSTHKQARKFQRGTKVLRHFHKMAPVLNSRHLDPLPLCSPTPFPLNLCCIFKNRQVFLYKQH